MRQWEETNRLPRLFEYWVVNQMYESFFFLSLTTNVFRQLNSLASAHCNLMHRPILFRISKRALFAKTRFERRIEAESKLLNAIAQSCYSISTSSSITENLLSSSNALSTSEILGAPTIPPSQTLDHFGKHLLYNEQTTWSSWERGPSNPALK